MTSPRGDEPILDHVVFAARSREEADRALTRAGLATTPGRTIPGMGLSNVFVPLGPTMLEVHHPNGEPATADGPPYAEIERHLLAEHPDVLLLPVTWLVRFENVDRLREVSTRDGRPVHELPPSGAVPAYVLGGFGAALERPWLPPLIHWPAPPEDRLAARPAPHRRQPSGELILDVSGPEQEIIDWCGGHPHGVRIVDGKSGPLRAHIAFVDGGSVAIGMPAG